MTRKDYILIAEALQNAHQLAVAYSKIARESKINTYVNGSKDGQIVGVADAVRHIADALASNNPRFDREYFLAVVRGEQEAKSRPIPKSVREARAGLIPSEETDNYADLENDIYSIWRTKKEKVAADGPYLGGIEYTVIDDEGSFIASCGVTLNDDAKIRARLIAAAPELLEACKKALAFYNEFEEISEQSFGQWGENRRKVRAAIAKAEGRG